MFEIARNGRVRAIEIVKSQKGFCRSPRRTPYSRVDTNRQKETRAASQCGTGRCAHAPFCALVFMRILVSYFAISTDEHAIIQAIIVAGTTWLRPAKFLASASGIVNVKRRKQMTSLMSG
jgi:hypothetical protein